VGVEKVLYLGDTELDAQASYLAGILAHFGVDFDYAPSDSSFEDKFLNGDYAAAILSDYPADNFNAEQVAGLVEKVRAGMGLLMIGGWESFNGCGTGYDKTGVADVLPVNIQPDDDRVNCYGPCVVGRADGPAGNGDEEIIDSLPFDEQVPVIGGFNRLQARKGAKVILTAEPCKIRRVGDDYEFTRGGLVSPLLVLGSFGTGRTAAFASDVAPHWVGPFVDWGDKRIKTRANGAEQIEVGNWYVSFFGNLIRWLCGPGQ
jgi:uncharacterized membrane protein